MNYSEEINISSPICASLVMKYWFRHQLVHLWWRNIDFVTNFKFFIIFGDEFFFSSLNVIIWWRNCLSSLNFVTITHFCCSVFWILLYLFCFKLGFFCILYDFPKICNVGLVFIWWECWGFLSLIVWLHMYLVTK